ncbi:hypothetical protein CERSUDRAFT_118471 [Gelatoporia subvermispora B]|uniref:TEA domain-containing protein n=1 Tax=Ceriporiopsis subvermispora (strain B) TaxID=914234 RepID=M2R1G4_CERS8|nr:hypothetical protein CERSUDRAFT_118471 [Gelatoporia subvermispora B]
MSSNRSSSRQKFAAHVRVSSVNDVSYEQTTTNGSGEAVNTILSERKCWRVMRDKDEVVWPPALEAALIEGLENYVPAESKSARGLGRFPMRNKFISEYILKKTGKARTPKQVGSRIQQLRDTDAGKNILKVLSDRHYEMMHPRKKSRSPEPCSPLSLTELESPSSPDSPLMHNTSTHVYITTLGSDAVFPTSSSLPTYLQQSVLSQPDGTLQWATPRRLCDIDPTITFVSSSMYSLHACSRVFRGVQELFSEDTQISARPMYPEQQQSSMSGECQALYTTRLIPSYWAHLCGVTDPWEYTIRQDIFRRPEDPASSTSQHPVLSVFYHFVSPMALDTSLVATNAIADHASPTLGTLLCDFSLLDPGIGSGSSTDGSSPRSSADESDSFFSEPLVDDVCASDPPSPLDCLQPPSVLWNSYASSMNLSIPSIAIEGNCIDLQSPYLSGFTGFGM